MGQPKICHSLPNFLSNLNDLPVAKLGMPKKKWPVYTNAGQGMALATADASRNLFAKPSKTIVDHKKDVKDDDKRDDGYDRDPADDKRKSCS